MPYDEWEQLYETAQTTEHAEIIPSELDGTEIIAAFHNNVLQDPKVKAWGECICFVYPELRGFFLDGVFEGIRLGSSYGDPVIVGTYWPVDLDAGDLAWDLARVASRGNRNNVGRPIARWELIQPAADAIVDRVNAFFHPLREAILIAVGVSEWRTPIKIPPGRWFDGSLNVALSKVPRWNAVTLRLPSSLASEESTLVSSAAPDAVINAKAPISQSKAGRPAEYDWEALFAPLRDHVAKHGDFLTKIARVHWCCEHVKLKSGVKKRNGNGPDYKTAVAAISKYGLDKIAP